ncbi:hypothetical protein [Microbacterium testaceum]|uniref:hypothetical protein n=1 Tax=Microbacterium testaceum TaxID=2033 RepID=UPI003826BCF4
MMEVFAIGIGGALLGCGVGVGLGLLMDLRSARAWIGLILVLSAFVLVVTSSSSLLFWCVPVLAVAFGITVTLVEAHTRRGDPLLAGESFARRVALILFHAKELKAAAKIEREYQLH